jgi:hypothetical protein
VTLIGSRARGAGTRRYYEGLGRVVYSQQLCGPSGEKGDLGEAEKQIRMTIESDQIKDLIEWV